MKNDVFSMGGGTTISPPSKIQSEDDLQGVRVLCSNVDTLNLSINVVWQSGLFFDTLTTMKKSAQEERKDKAVFFQSPSGNKDFLFNVKAHGAKGYEWILDNNEYLLNVGNWREPQSMPSVMVYIKSETLWRQGPQEAIKNIIFFLIEQQGLVKEVKLSRVDLCVDTLFPEDLWDMDLFKLRVTQATSGAMYFDHTNLSGMSFGKGVLSARMYDKYLEIKQSSKKTWMFDIWGYTEPPKGKKIIRVEFQLRREAIKDLGCDECEDLPRLQDNLWKYCTKTWLKFQDSPHRQSKYRKTYPWWIDIQNGYQGSKDAIPAIRAKAVKKEKDQLFLQANGSLTSMAALLQEFRQTDFDSVITMEDLMDAFETCVKEKEINADHITQAVKDKRSKYYRSVEKLKAATRQRQALGLAR